MEIKNEVPILKSIEELASFLVKFWLNGGVTYFKEKGNIADTANMLKFIDAHDKLNNPPLLSEEEMKEAEKNCFKYFIEALVQYGFNVCSESYGMGDFFEQVYGDKIHSREFSVPGLFMTYFNTKKQYSESEGLSEERLGGKENKDRLLEKYPGGGVLCTRSRGEHWKIIASLQIPYLSWVQRCELKETKKNR